MSYNEQNFNWDPIKNKPILIEIINNKIIFVFKMFKFKLQWFTDMLGILFKSYFN